MFSWFKKKKHFGKMFELFKHDDIYDPCGKCLDIIDQYKVHRVYIQCLTTEISRLKEREKELTKMYHDIYDELMEQDRNGSI